MAIFRKKSKGNAFVLVIDRLTTDLCVLIANEKAFCDVLPLMKSANTTVDKVNSVQLFNNIKCFTQPKNKKRN